MNTPVRLFPFGEYWPFYLGFLVLVFVLLALDLGVFHRKAHAVSIREAASWSVVWVTLALLFNVAFFVYMRWHFPLDARLMAVPGFDPLLAARETALEFLAGYVVEYSLSIDNIFVFVIVFRYFSIPREHQHRILYWGILGALIMRGALILAGAAAVARFHWLLYVFGAFLVYTGLHLLWKDPAPPAPDRNPAVRLASRIFPIARELHAQHFFVRLEGRLHATPLFLVLLVVETTDLLFAFDSIPAVFGVTHDSFIIYTSNVFAILGLRAMYFLLAAIIPSFRFLNYGLSTVLVFIGLRMLVEKWIEIPIGVALSIVVGILAVAVAASLIPARRVNPED